MSGHLSWWRKIRCCCKISEQYARMTGVSNPRRPPLSDTDCKRPGRQRRGTGALHAAVIATTIMLTIRPAGMMRHHHWPMTDRAARHGHHRRSPMPRSPRKPGRRTRCHHHGQKHHRVHQQGRKPLSRSDTTHPPQPVIAPDLSLSALRHTYKAYPGRTVPATHGAKLRRVIR